MSKSLEQRKESVVAAQKKIAELSAEIVHMQNGKTQYNQETQDSIKAQQDAIDESRKSLDQMKQDAQLDYDNGEIVAALQKGATIVAEKASIVLLEIKLKMSENNMIKQNQSFDEHIESLYAQLADAQKDLKAAQTSVKKAVFSLENSELKMKLELAQKDLQLVTKDLKNAELRLENESMKNEALQEKIDSLTSVDNSELAPTEGELNAHVTSSTTEEIA